MERIKDYEAMAKISLSEGERRFIGEKAGMLRESFDALKDFAVNAEPMVTVLDTTDVLRPDVSMKTVSREELLENAPEAYDGYFIAPRTLE